MKSFRPQLLLLLGVAVSLVVASCGGGAEGTPTAVLSGPTATAGPAPTGRPTATTAPAPTATAVAVPTGQLRFAFEIFSIYSLLPGFSFTRSYMDPMFDALAGQGADGQLDQKTGFVTSWQSSPDLKSWTLKTRDGVLFQNGEQATAKDLKFSLEYYAHSGTNPSASGLAVRQALQASVDSPDDSTVIVATNAADAFALYKLLPLSGPGVSNGYLLPKAYMESNGADLTKKDLKVDFLVKNPLGSGPYKFKSDISAQEVNLEYAERAHWLYGIPRFRAVQVKAIPDTSTRVALLKTGGLEGANTARSSTAELKQSGFDVHPGGNARYAPVNMQEQYKESYPGYGKNPLFDVRVRQALSLAVDREVIVQKFMGGQAVPTVAALHPWDLGYKAYPVFKQDLAKAKALLAEAGFAAGFTLTMYQFGIPGLSEGPEIMEAVAVWWESLSIKVDRKPLDTAGTYTGLVPKGFSSPTVAGISAPAGNTITPGNVGGVKTQLSRVTEDNEIDQAVKDVAAVTSLSDYITRVRRLEELYQQKWINLPMFTFGAVYAVRQGLGGDRWDLGRGTTGTSVNLNQLATGKVIVR